MKNPNKLPFAVFAAFLTITLFSNCKGETFFHANFEGNTVGQTPATNQKVGTTQKSGPPGSVLVTNAPPTLTGKWVKVERQSNPNTVSVFQGTLKSNPSPGKYVFSALLYIPSNSEVVSVQFGRYNQPVDEFGGFLHLDFLKNNKVRIDDDSNTEFGTFPRDQVFIVQVTLNTLDPICSADILLSGAGASGEAHRVILSPFQQSAHQFGSFRLWIGFPWVGDFSATNILVKRKDEN